MIPIKAFLFDLNGTMIDDMDFHIRAWHNILTQLGAQLSLAEVKKECYGKNDELLERIFPGRFSETEMKNMSIAKETAYKLEFKPFLQMAIGSAAIRFNIDFVLDGLSIRHFFKSIVSAEDVIISKPDPETYLKCATALGIAPEQCIVFEDAPKGVEAAKNAGMRCVVITTMHTREEFSMYDNVVCFIADYDDIQLNQLFN